MNDIQPQKPDPLATDLVTLHMCVYIYIYLYLYVCLEHMHHEVSLYLLAKCMAVCFLLLLAYVFVYSRIYSATQYMHGLTDENLECMCMRACMHGHICMHVRHVCKGFGFLNTGISTDIHTFIHTGHISHILNPKPLNPKPMKP